MQAAVADLQTPPSVEAPVVKTCKSSTECAPTIAGDGADIAIAAPGGR